MTAARRLQSLPSADSCLETALWLLDCGLWPVPITSPDDSGPSAGKKPIGEEWGKWRHTAESLRAIYAAYPTANLGLRLGRVEDPYLAIVDVDVEDRSVGMDTLLDLLGGGLVATLGWESERGPHFEFRWDERILRYQKAILKGDWLPGVELRFGASTPGGKQYQSVCPPSRSTNGFVRTWNGHVEIARLPDAFFAYIDRHLPQASSRPFATRRQTTSQVCCPSGSWDAEQVKAAILPHIGDLAAEWGVRFTGRVLDGDWAECHAIDREDRTPSAGLCLTTGVLHDFGSTAPALSVFNLALALGTYPDFASVVNCLGERFGVPRAQPRKTIPMASLNGDGHGSNGQWEDPEVFRPLAPVSFPVDVLPPPLADLCTEAAAALQCPVDYLAASALVLAGAAIGLSVSLKVGNTWKVAPNLFMALVGTSGVKKSPPLLLLAGALWDVERDLRGRYEAEKATYRLLKRSYDQKSKGKDDPGPPPAEPVLAQLTLDDFTRESVAQVHAENPRGLVVVMDELSAWVSGLDAYRGGKGADKEFWLRVNSNSMVKVNRKGSPEPLIVPRPCIGVLGPLTPAMLPSIRATKADDGWLDRILFVYPDPPAGPRRWREADVPVDLLDAWKRAIRELWSRPLVVGEDGQQRPYWVFLDAEAKALWAEVYDAHWLETEQDDFSFSLHGPWSKMELYILRLALILAQLRWCYDPLRSLEPPNVAAADLRGAARLMDYFKVMFRRARAEITKAPADDMPECAVTVLRWIKKHRKVAFDWSDLTVAFPRSLTAADRREAVEWLQAKHVLRPQAVETKAPGKVGRPYLGGYEVNPLLDLNGRVF